MRAHEAKGIVGQFSGGWWFWFTNPSYMKTAIPTRQTLVPSQEGLAYHEILADGLIHVARVFGFADDERFVERVAALAWANAARLVSTEYWRASALAPKLAESLEVGRTETQKLCLEVAAAVASSGGDPLSGIRHYYQEVRHCRGIDPSQADASDVIRQLVGEAALGGLYSRALGGEAYRQLVAQIGPVQRETFFLTNRLRFWARNSGVPRFHPFMEFCAAQYPGDVERELLCTAFERRLPTIAEAENPWELDHWVTPGWRDGVIVSAFAPDLVQELIAATPPGSWASTRGLFQENIATKTAPNERPDIARGFAQYVAEHSPGGLADDAICTENPRLLAWTAFDYAFWMGIVSEVSA